MNLNKMSEDAIIDLMEREYDKNPESGLLIKLDAELDRRAEIYNKQQEQIKLQKQKEEEIRQALLAQYNKIVEETGQRVTMKAMVAEFGYEYLQNYYVDSSYTVHSFAESKTNATWECEDINQANKKVEQLIYYRVYDKYFRDGPTNSTLERLQAKIVEVLSENKKHE